jgi:argonaute-like protein implicated in RNA metabolism and viral defense
VYKVRSKHIIQTALNKVIISIVAKVSQYQVKSVKEDRTGYRQLKRLEKKKKAMNIRVAEKKKKKKKIKVLLLIQIIIVNSLKS